MTRRVRVLSALLSLVMVVSVGGAHEGDLHERITETKDELARAEQGLDTVTEQVGSAVEQLDAADRQLVALEAELREHEAQLAAAQASYEAARARTAEATRTLEAVTQRLARTEADLADREQRFDARIATAYKYGNVSYASALIGADDVEDFVNTMYYVRSVMRSDRTMIDSVTETARAVASDRKEADALREDLATQEAAAARLKVDVERATEAQRKLTAMVTAERANRAQLVTTLEATKADYEALVDSLEAESKKLAEELRKSQYSGTRPGRGGLLWPTNGRKTSEFGYRTHPIYGTRRMHTGIDIGAPTGQTIVAVAKGKVVSAGWRGGYGLAVVIDHGGGLATLYGHQSRLTVSAGEVVSQGQKIGEVGSTGNSTGPHLHFEVRVNGEPRNPMEWY